MSTVGWQYKEILNPRGAWTSSSLLREGNPSRASIAMNMRFSPGFAYSREGTSAVLATVGKVTGMYNWIAPNDHNYVIYQDLASLIRYDQNVPLGLTMKSSLTQRAPSISDLGIRLYTCGYDTSGNGVTQAFVHDGGTTGGVPDMDLCFRPPLQVTSMTVSDLGGGGQCTAGTHYLGFIYQTRTGFAGKPSPVNGSGVFTPAPITIAAGHGIGLSVTLNTPADAGGDAAFFPIITRADNPNEWYFVPDVFALIPASTSSYTATFIINISDADLATSATLATDNFSLLTADPVTGTGPFLPQFVRAYGRRMTYGVNNKLYVSAILDPQNISEDRSVVQTQNQRKIVTAFPLGQFLYLAGDKWTARVNDGDVDAVTWPQPMTVSDSIGTPATGGVEWRTAGDYAWVASESGVYVFNGSYPSRPITYFVSDQWARVNWKAAYAIQIADDVVNLRCYVGVPLGVATEMSHMFVIDYTNGLEFDSCDISIDQYFGFFSSVCMVKEFQTNKTVLWKGPVTAGNITHLDTSTHDDEGNAIHPIWATSNVRQPGELDSTMMRVGRSHTWIRGNGTLIQTWKGLDGVASVQPPNITLSTTPGKEYYSKKDLNPVENFTLQYETFGVGEWFSISGIRPWYKPSRWVR